MAWNMTEYLAAFDAEAADIAALATEDQKLLWFRLGQKRFRPLRPRWVDRSWVAGDRSMDLPDVDPDLDASDFVQLDVIQYGTGVTPEGWRQWGKKLVHPDPDGASAAGSARIYYWAIWGGLGEDGDTVVDSGAAIYGHIQRNGLAVAQTMPSGGLNATTLALRHNVVTFQGDVTCDIVSNPSRIVAGVSGLYLAIGSVVFEAVGASDHGFNAGFGVSGTGAIWSPVDTVRKVLTSSETRLNYTLPLRLSAGDYVTQVVGQNSGGNLAAPLIASLYLARIGPKD